MVGVVDPPKAAAFAGTETPSDETLTDPRFIETVLRDIYRLGDKNKLNSLEKPK